MSLSEADTTGPAVTKGDAILKWLKLRALPEALPEQQLFLWSPVFLAAGIWAYFALESEPSLILAITCLCIAAALILLSRNRALLLALAIFLTGFSAAKIRTETVRTPMLQATTSVTNVAGTVSKIERKSARRHTLTIDVAKLSNIPESEIPAKIQITAFGALPDLMVGDMIETTARLRPLPRPVKPGGFDYARQLYFLSIGATGETTGKLVVAGKNTSLTYASGRFFASLRLAIHERITAFIPEPLASFANALITGDRSAIPKPINDSLQKSGLAHILSISGLHMALVAGGVFTLVRALLALSPVLALSWPIKKYAAAAALGVGLFYMLLADSGSATERSYIMIAIVFFAVIVDRPALSMHNLALAGIIILLFQPEQAMSASFQMSFMAVMGLAALFEWWSRRERRTLINPSVMSRLWAKSHKSVLLAILTSIVAGLLSGIPAAHHFGRLAPYSVAANAVALPITSFIVMPAALLSVFSMPIGIEWLPLTVMQFGLDLTVKWSDWVNTWPGSGVRLPLLSGGAAVALSMSAAIICIGRLRGLLIGIAALPAIGAAALPTVQPDVLLDDKMQNVVVRSIDGELYPLKQGQRGFALRKWLESEGKDASSSLAKPWTCSPMACMAEIKGKRIVVLKREAEATKPCPEADILIAQYPLRKSCRGEMATIDRFDVWRSGAHALYLAEAQIRIETSKELQGNRPWTYVSRPRH